MERPQYQTIYRRPVISDLTDIPTLIMASFKHITLEGDTQERAIHLCGMCHSQLVHSAGSYWHCSQCPALYVHVPVHTPRKATTPLSHHGLWDLYRRGLIAPFGPVKAGGRRLRFKGKDGQEGREVQTSMLPAIKKEKV